MKKKRKKRIEIIHSKFKFSLCSIKNIRIKREFRNQNESNGSYSLFGS